MQPDAGARAACGCERALALACESVRHSNENAAAAIGDLSRRFCTLDRLVRQQIAALAQGAGAAPPGAVEPWRRFLDDLSRETAGIIEAMQFEDRFQQRQAALARLLEGLRDAGAPVALLTAPGPEAGGLAEMGEAELF